MSDSLDELIAAFVRNPDSPAGLQLQSMINRGLRPVVEARAQALNAILGKLRAEVPALQADQAIAASQQHLAQVLGLSTLPQLVASELEQQAADMMRRKAPPPLESIVPEAAGRSDVGYEQGIHLAGVRGAWHRLWALMVLGAQMGDNSAGALDAESAVRTQLEDALGFKLTDEQLVELRNHAERAAGDMPSLG